MSEEFEKLKAILKSDPSVVRELAWQEEVEGFEGVDEAIRDSGRWVQYIQTIVKGPSGALYAFDWGKGLTENQDDEYYNAADSLVEVEAKDVVTTVRKYVKVKVDSLHST
jgi:hypothetical protein